MEADISPSELRATLARHEARVSTRARLIAIGRERRGSILAPASFFRATPCRPGPSAGRLFSTRGGSPGRRFGRLVSFRRGRRGARRGIGGRRRFGSVRVSAAGKQANHRASGQCHAEGQAGTERRPKSRYVDDGAGSHQSFSS
jgi:hypothetical protein